MYSGNAQKKNLLGAAVIAAVLAVPLASTSVSAQPPVIIGGGLVNVQIGTIRVEDNEVLSDIIVQVPVNAALQLAANVCGVSVYLIAADFAPDNIADCDSEQTQRGGDQILRTVHIE